MNIKLAGLLTGIQWEFIRVRLRHHLIANLRGSCDDDLLDELSQEVLLRLLQVPFEAHDLEELVCKILDWNHKASSRVVMEWFRLKQRQQQRSGSDTDLHEVPSPVSHKARELDWPADRPTIAAAVSALPPRQQMAIQQWMNGDDFLEIAKAMECDVGTVRTYVSRGLKKLSKLLKLTAR